MVGGHTAIGLQVHAFILPNLQAGGAAITKQV